MITAPLPPNEAARLAALHDYGVLDTPEDARFDRIAALAARMLGMPIALVSLVDAERQWFKAHYGLAVRESPRDASFCSHAIADGAFLEVPDATADTRFADNPLVLGDPQIRFYAGATLLDPQGYALGTLCVIDRQPRVLSDTERAVLQDLAALALDALLLDRARHEAEQARREAEYANRAKTNFLAFMSHELRTPLNAVIGFGELLSAESFGPLGSERYKHYAGMIVEGGRHLLEVINAILDMSRIEAGHFKIERQPLSLAEEVAAVLALVRVQADSAGVALEAAPDLAALGEVQGDRAALRQVLLNLVGNALKFTPSGGKVQVSGAAEAGMIRLCIADNGAGIAPEDLRRLGEPFYQSGPVLARRAEGSGLGLAISKRLMALHGGKLEIESVLGEGTKVSISLPQG